MDNLHTGDWWISNFDSRNLVSHQLASRVYASVSMLRSNLAADNFPCSAGFVRRNPYWTLTVRTVRYRRPCVSELHTETLSLDWVVQVSAFHASSGLCAGTPDWSHLTPRDIRNHSPRIASIKLTMFARAVFTPSRKIAGSTPFFSTNKKRLCSNILRSHRFSLFPNLRHPQMDTSCDPWYRWRYRSGPRTSLNPTLPARERVWPI